MFKQIFNLFKSDSLYVQALEECHEMLDIDLNLFVLSFLFTWNNYLNFYLF